MSSNSIYFMLSGVGPGAYTFTQNPERMNTIAPKSENKIVEIIRGENIYMRPLLDQDMRKMTWKRTTSSVYTNLRTFSTRDVNGDIPVSYFWDGTVNEFQGAPVKVVEVYGKPLVNDAFGSSNSPTSPDDTAWSVELLFRPVRV